MAVNYVITDDEILGAPSIYVQDTAARGLAGNGGGIQLGGIVTGVDTSTAAYGSGEFMYVAFTGTCAAGDFVVVDRAAKTAVQASQSTIYGEIGIAMAAQVNGQFGFVMLRGIHDGANVATGQAAGTRLGASTTAGRATATSAGFKFDGAFERLITSASNVGTVELAWPVFSGNG